MTDRANTCYVICRNITDTFRAEKALADAGVFTRAVQPHLRKRAHVLQPSK